ncbi:hypothetical protein BLA29_006584 [Euroglyphus maynei]|uniref:Uncharacterized protein n=1 Tax=Euroglyphus maynei TaxID=6958 RepID=A0A1Y3BF77_EURMA|nr:hypothetical protein BLA29_006584 [Euroglyphus maynei]
MEKNQIECEENNGDDEIYPSISTMVTNGGRRAPVTELLIAAAAVDSSSTTSSSYPGDFGSSPTGSLSNIAQIDCLQEWSLDQSCMPFLCDDVDDEPQNKNNNNNNNDNDIESFSIDHSLALPSNRFISTNKRVLDETDIDQWLSDQKTINNNKNVQSNFNENNNKKADSSNESFDFPFETQQQHHNIIANSKCAKLVTHKQNFSSQMLPSPKMISSDIVDNVFEMKESRTKNRPKLYQPTQSDEWYVFDNCQ